MTSECVEIVNWLKNWFTPKDEEYYYDMTVSNYNPTIDSNITVGVYVTDGNGDPVNNHSFQLWIGDSTSVTLTTDSQGYAGYTYNCSDWGVRRFSVGTSVTFIKVGGWKRVANETQYQVYENVDSYYVVINTSVTFSSTSWAGVFTIPEPYRPLIHIPLSCTDKQVNGRYASTGVVQVINLGTTQRTTGINGIAVIKK